MGSFKKIFFFIGRLCLRDIFLFGAFAHISDFDGMESALTNSLYSISEHSHGIAWVQKAVEEIMPFVSLLAVSALILLVLGGGLVLIGIKYKLGATLLLIFLLPVTFIMHHYYFLEGPDKQLQMTMFWKNLAICGGLLVLATYPKPSSYEDGDEV
jgi:putative oxidoreductase